MKKAFLLLFFILLSTSLTACELLKEASESIKSYNPPITCSCEFDLVLIEETIISDAITAEICLKTTVRGDDCGDCSGCEEGETPGKLVDECSGTEITSGAYSMEDEDCEGNETCDCEGTVICFGRNDFGVETCERIGEGGGSADDDPENTGQPDD